MPSRSQAASTAGSIGQRGLVEHDGQVGGLGQLVADRADPAAGRVAQPAGRRRRREQRVDQIAERRGVGADVGLEREVAPGQHHGHAVVGDGARHEHDVAGLARGRARACGPRGCTPTPAVVMYRPSAAPRSTTLVSPATMATPAARAASAMSATMSRSSAIGEALLEHERGRQPPRPGPEHGEVVDGAVHGEVPDRPAREEAGPDDERVGAEREPVAAGQVEAGGVGQRREVVVGERLEEHGVDQRGRRLAAGAVGQRDDLVGQAGPPPAEGLDALEHRGLAGLSAPSDPPRPSRRWTRSHRSNTTALWVSWMRCTLSDRTTRQWSIVAGDRHAAAVVAGQPDGEQAPAPRLGERQEQVLRAAAGRQAEGDVAGLAVAMSCRENTSSKPTSLARAVSTAWSATSDRAGSGRPARRVREQGDDAGGVGGAAAVAEREQPATGREPLGHRRSGGRVEVGGQRPSGSRPRSAWLVAALASADAARSASSGPASRSSPSMNG